jgi:hypothetical protein
MVMAKVKLLLGLVLLGILGSAGAKVAAGRSDSGTQTGFRFPEAKHGKGELKYVNSVPVLTVAGTPEEMGTQIGVLALKPLNDELNLDEFIRQLLKANRLELGLPLLTAATNALFQRFPESDRRELEAMARAAGVKRDILVTINTAIDLYNLPGCSCLLVGPERSATGKPLFGRNLDHPPLGHLHKFSLVIVYQRRGKAPFASITFPGLIVGFSGMNRAGLCLATDGMYSTADGSPRFSPLGTPIFASVRRILEDCTTVAETEKWLRTHPATTWIGLVVCDRAGGTVFEITSKNVIARRPQDGICSCTNHFVSKELATSTQCWRYPLLEQSRKLPKLDVAEVGKKMHAVNQGNDTLQTMIFEPADLRLHLAAGKGPASSLPLQMLDLKPYLRGGSSSE